MFEGSMVAIVTPMRAGVAPETPLDLDALRRLIDWHIAEGTDAIVAVGTTGESATLDMEEHVEVIRQTIKHVRGRVPVIAGTGANSTTEAIELTEAAKTAGADACLLVTPYYNKPTQEGLYQHHKIIAERVAIPQILYNVPGRTACDMQPETVARLARVPNIIGIKEATGDMGRLDRIRSSCGDKFLLFSGDDATATEFMLRGGHGVISVTANVAPKAMHELCVQARRGDRGQATHTDTRLAGLHKELFCEANPIPTKWALEQMGRIEAGIRLPLTWLSAACHERVRRAMEQAGVAKV
ncbi:MAG TPA: 4-hydroxy-tetrahydrodipicolinate synthase [Gammaproteobacteria bacterium]|nr:4-hydroxy-tetrahydrodipicolinate synthase [Gammaproteobacteria bacterium]